MEWVLNPKGLVSLQKGRDAERRQAQGEAVRRRRRQGFKRLSRPSLGALGPPEARQRQSGLALCTSMWAPGLRSGR